MRRPILTAVALAAAATLAAPPAYAAPLIKESFTEPIDDTFDCSGTPVHDRGSITVHTVATVRGPSSDPDLFPYFREHNNVRLVSTNLDTGRSVTQVGATSFHDAKITDNGDGTLTIVNQGAGSFRMYDDTGKLVHKDPGMVQFQFSVYTNGTPGDPTDDTDVPDSFSIVRPSTGNSDFSDVDFCDILREFTAAP